MLTSAKPKNDGTVLSVRVPAKAFADLDRIRAIRRGDVRASLNTNGNVVELALEHYRMYLESALA